MASASRTCKWVPDLVIFESGKGATLTDVEGYEYLDAMPGITVAHLGHSELAPSNPRCRT
jgi:4-aminobutyrate aminotransferase-like enzyme